MPVALWLGGCLTCLVLPIDPVSCPRLVRPARTPISFSDSRALGLTVLFLNNFTLYACLHVVQRHCTWQICRRNDDGLVWSCAYKNAHGHGWLHLHRFTWRPGAGGLWLLMTATEQHASTLTAYEATSCADGEAWLASGGKAWANQTSPVEA